MTMECVEKLIKKDMLDPINGKHMKEKDIIQLERVRQYGPQGDKNILILHLSCRTSDLQFSLALQTQALVL